VTLLGLDDVAELPAEQVGGKARGLGRLAALGLPVPDARVLDVAAHARFLRDGALSEEDRRALADAAQALGAPLAVRSSAADEDAADRSAAGQYESVMGVDGAAALAAAVERCYAAAGEERASAYRGSGEAAVAVVIQREIEAERAGVAFSVDPVTGARDAVVVEAVLGHGEGIVSGEVTPDRYRVQRAGGRGPGHERVRVRRADQHAMADGRGGLRAVADERRLARVLRDDEARGIAALVERAEAGFGAPVDVEFCFAGEDLWLVQCRPVTALHAAA
jgi:phosphoenolpyruvate synthase/pyruvate phosphate dikinase